MFAGEGAREAGGGVKLVDGPGFFLAHVVDAGGKGVEELFLLGVAALGWLVAEFDDLFAGEAIAEDGADVGHWVGDAEGF